MKMAKASKRDIDAAGNLMSLLHQIDRGDYPRLEEGKKVPTWFDEDNFEHLRAFYDAVKATLDAAPGYPGRVIGGMCYVILYDKNEIVDPDSDVIELHPKLVKALSNSERWAYWRARAGFSSFPEKPIPALGFRSLEAPSHDMDATMFGEDFMEEVDRITDEAIEAKDAAEGVAA
jgi:hypothetical protein